MFVLTEGVREYRATIDRIVRPDDVVLEVGCATGTTSALLAAKALRVVAVDASPSALVRARAFHPGLRFELADAFDVTAMLAFGEPFNVVYVDLSGSRPPERVMALVRGYRAALSPRVIVVKNTRLKSFVRESEMWGA